MGYYVQITKSTAVIPKANLQRAYEKMCALNVTHHNQKHGGSYKGGEKCESWFSWMDANYPAKCKDAQAVLDMLGFSTEYNQQGDLLITYYDNKMGQEDLFMEAIKNEAVGKIHWRGEEGDAWTTEFFGDLVIEAEQPVRLLK